MLPLSLPILRGLLAFGLLAILSISGCGGDNEAKGRPLLGTWVLVEGEEVARRTSSAESTLDQQAEPRMQLEFSTGGRLQTLTNINAIDSRKSGTWQVVAYDNVKKVMDIECVLDGQTTKSDVNFLGDDQIKLCPPNMSGLTLKLTFKRKK